jgi:hypothetical protein
VSNKLTRLVALVYNKKNERLLLVSLVVFCASRSKEGKSEDVLGTHHGAERNKTVRRGLHVRCDGGSAQLQSTRIRECCWGKTSNKHWAREMR